MTTTTSEPRVIGRRRSAAPRIEFTLLTYRGDDEEPYTMTARANMDTSSVFSLGAHDVTGGQRVAGLRDLIKRALVDDDGWSVRYVPVQVVEQPTEDTTDDSSETAPSTELVPYEADKHEIAKAQWRLGRWDRDEQTWRYEPDSFPSESLAKQAADSKPSSLRRFAMIMDDAWLVLEQSALEEIVDLIVSAAADRPTEPSNALSRSRPRRAR